MNMNDEQKIIEGMNTGVLIQDPRPTDYIAGDAATGLPFENRNPSGDWQPYLPTAEMQIGVYFDTMACVTFSALNSIETQLNFMLATGLIPKDKEAELRELGVLVGNQFNFSDRFTAKMSGTTKQGNYLVNVWDSIRNHGLVAESDWPYPREQRQPVFDWDDYYKEIPQEVKDKALKLSKLGDILDIKYEWLAAGVNATKEQIKSWLPMSPVQIATAVCPPWGGGAIVPSCSLAVAHATMIRNAPEVAIGIFDHYVPYEKQIANDYKIPYALRGMVYMKQPVQPTIDPAFGKRLAGKLLLGVEDKGSIWYVNANGTRVKIGRSPEEVANFLQKINEKKVDHLGINNADLAKIATV